MRGRPWSRRLVLSLAVLLAAGLLAATPLLAAPDPLAPAGSGGMAELSRALDRLGQHRRLMIIGAHPDDEDDTLLSVASLGDGAEVAYLSLTRGEGGQNVIGDELGESLGVLRSEELLAGRRIDRGRQLFTRAYDFGYTESMAESFGRWPREELLVDVVRAIRRFRPEVVVAVFPPDERAGHGQHQASGALADEALRVAGEPAALPQLAAEGLLPWQPKVYFREAWRDPTAATVTLPSQRLDALTGRTLFQIAMEVRSLHRSQSEGQLQALEGRPVRLRNETPLMHGGFGFQGADFAGVDTRLWKLSDLLPAGAERDRLMPLLDQVENEVQYARSAAAPSGAVWPLVRALHALREASALVAASPSAASGEARHLAAFIAEKEEIASEALAAALGLVVDASADRAEVVPGSELGVTVRLLDGGTAPLRVRALTLESPAGWTAPVAVSLRSSAASAAASAAGGAVVTSSAAGPAVGTSAPAAAAPTAPVEGATAGTGPTTPSPPVEGAAAGTTGSTAPSATTTAVPPASIPPDAALADAMPGPEPTSETPPESVSLESGALLTLPARVAVDAAATPTAPYFLRHPRQGDLYDWSDVPAEVRGEPFEPPPLLLRAEIELVPEPVNIGPRPEQMQESRFEALSHPDGEPAEAPAPDPEPEIDHGPPPVVFTLTREVVAVSRSLSRGEVRRPLRAVPAVEVSVAQGMLPWPLADTASRRLRVTLEAHAAVEGQLSVVVPEGWPPVPLQPFQLPAGEKRTFELPLAPPSPLATGRTALEVGAVTVDGARYSQSFPLVDYEHVRPRPIPTPARVAISAFPLELPTLHAVGYVRGAADHEPEALLAVGVPLQGLTPADLLSRNLADFDALVIGPRAYDAAPELAAANSRLQDFVRDGGLLIVQSQRADYFTQKLAPLQLDMARGNATRTTDETAPVRLLQPEHAAFTTPNVLDASDWEGWVQERGLYYPQTWDEAYVPLIAMADPGKTELDGALLVAPYGQGTFVYTGIAFFRQLPAGVPGAYRLFANLLALAKPRVQSEDLPAEGQ